MNEIFTHYLKGLGESFYPLTLIYTVGKTELSIPSYVPKFQCSIWRHRSSIQEGDDEHNHE